MPLKHEMELMELDVSPKPISVTSSEDNDATAKPHYNEQNRRYSTTNRLNPQEAEPAALEETSYAQQTTDPETTWLPDGADDEGFHVEDDNKYASTLPPSPELEAVEDEEMAGWVKEQQTSQPSLRLYRGSPGDILVMARTAAPSFPIYYPRELNMDDEC
ncbi:hypothetical protein QC763_0017290 [Podospora pseudopauciseta]|uniref:Uncharacterized protein n=1 Tax=Podospora pseudopauciseta TaxID=2093780 RepID=A0ABR0I0A0_9PEZI|nr:hypothetical protein QC763_0017290 [Podospora pseudopauciseta]